MSKKIVLISGVVFTVIFGIFFTNDIKYSYCGYNALSCWERFNLLKIILFIAPSFLFASIVVLSSSEEVFRKWKRLTGFFIPTYLAIITIIPWEVGDEIAGFSKGTTGLVLSSQIGRAHV